jgi:hypothetical protein
MPTARRGTASIEVAVPPEVVYLLVSDVTRMGEWSPECYRCTWLDDVGTAVPGARFRGYNKLGNFRWQTTAVIRRGEDGKAVRLHDRAR